MNILLSCLQDLKSHQMPAYHFWVGYFKNGLVEAGHDYMEVPEVDWAQGITPLDRSKLLAWRDATWSKTIEFIDRSQRAGRGIDLFLSYFYPQQIEPDAIQEIRRRGIPCINFFCDNVREFTRVPAAYRCFDLHWVPEFEALGMYAKAGLAIIHAPMPVWVSPQHRTPSAEKVLRPTFIGSNDALRQDLLGHAIEAGADIAIRGPGWASEPPADTRPSSKGTLRNQWSFMRDRGIKQWLRKTQSRFSPPQPHLIDLIHLEKPVSEEDYVRLTRESIVTIGINRVPSFVRSWRDPLKYSRLRDIEAPMMGACYLTEWTEGLSHLYDLGVEIETYRTAEELVVKLKELESDPAKRKRMRRLGQQRAVTDLTVGKSLDKIRLAIRSKI